MAGQWVESGLSKVNQEPRSYLNTSFLFFFFLVLHISTTVKFNR